MDDKEYYARLRREMEKKKDVPVKNTKQRKKRQFVGKSINTPIPAELNDTPITSDDIMNIRISAETSEDVLDFIRRV